MTASMIVDEAFKEVSPLTDYELSIEIVQTWSRNNANTRNIDWRQMHAAANLFAIRQLDEAHELAKRKANLVEAKQELQRTESKANLTAMVNLMAGRAKDPEGKPIAKEFSYSAAKEVAKQFEALDPDVQVAQHNLIAAEREYTRAQNTYDALVQLAQSGKSTAQRLMQEPS